MLGSPSLFANRTTATLLVPYFLSLLISSPTPSQPAHDTRAAATQHDQALAQQKQERSTIFHILRLAVYAALSASSPAQERASALTGSLRRTGLDSGLGLVLSGVGVLVGFAKSLGSPASSA